MVNESLTTRLARERLSAIQKILPLRDRIREKLQQRQSLQTDFSEDTEQLFKPVVKATKDVKTATERAIYGDIPAEGERVERPLLPVFEKIAKRTKQTKKSLKTLPGDIITTARQLERQEQQERELQEEVERLGDIDISSSEMQAFPPEPEEFQEQEEQEQEEEEEGAVSTKSRVTFIDKFTPTGIIEIKRFQLLKPNDYTAFGNFAVQSYYSRERFLKDEYKESKISRDDWVDWLFKTNQNISRLKKEKLEYKMFTRGIENYDLQQQEEKQQKEEEKQQEQQRKREAKTKKKTGKGYSPMDFHSSVGNSSVTCPGNILGDIARLEVLVGGKRAGNNSLEIINEAADICRRLFQGGIMDIATYRDFIEELVDGYHSD